MSTVTPSGSSGRSAYALLLLTLGGLLLVFALAASPAAAAGSGDYPPPASGNWVVTNPTAVSNETLQINGTLYVQYSSLELDNVTLLINSPSWTAYGIYVYPGSSRLVINNSSVTTSDAATRFYFYNYATLSIERSEVSRLSTWGILTYSGDIVIRSNTIHNGSYGGITALFGSSQPTTLLENNTLYDIDYFAMFLQYYSYFGAGAGPHTLAGDFVVRGN